MYLERVKALSKMYKILDNNNKFYESSLQSKNLLENQINFLEGMINQLKVFDLSITKKESEWRENTLSLLETEIIHSLGFVFPTDGYNIKLTTQVNRGKIHVVVNVASFFTDNMPGQVKGMQGRLFQQIVSSSALISVMSLLGIKTVYIDEAFSGASKSNIKKINRLIKSLKERGFNLIIISQDMSIADGLESNCLFLSRSLGNETSIVQR